MNTNNYWEKRLKGFELEAYFNEENKEEFSEATTYKEDKIFATEELLKLLHDIAPSDKAKYMVLLSVLGVLIQKITSKSEALICTPLFSLKEESSVFKKTIPVRISNTNKLTLKALLIQLTSCLKADFENENSLIDDVWNKKLNATKIGMYLKQIQVDNFSQSNYPDLQFIFSANNELSLEIKCNSDCYNFNYIREIAKRYFILLKTILVQKDKQLKDCLLTTEEELQELKLFNEQPKEQTYTKKLNKLFEEQVSKSPKALAIKYKESELTYEELNAKANQLANYLLKQGLRSNEMVGVYLDRSIETMIGLLGILKAGGTYLPMSPQFPKERVDYILQKAEVKILLTHQELLKTSFSFHGKVLDINTPEITSESPNNIESNGLVEEIAYCIFTSGSTGTPKGVMVSHKSVINLVNGLKEKVYHNLTSQLRVAMLASHVFDASIQQIFGALLQGHSLYIASQEECSAGNNLLNFYEKNNIQLSDGTPTHFRLLVRELEEGYQFKEFKVWILAGEELPKKVIAHFFKKVNGEIQIFNMYGPTETCVDSTYYPLLKKEIEKQAFIPIGKPLPNERVYITDAYGNLMPIGIIGELIIAGDGVAHGYLKEEKLTGEKFRKNWIRGEEKVYKTGDLGMWLPNGNLKFVGRKDDQIKLRGYRIEFGDIENSILSFHAVKEVVVDLREYKNEPCLVAYCVVKENNDMRNIRDFLSNKLPEYMIPSYYVELKELPLTTSGKLNKKILPDPEINVTEEHKLPENKTEEKLLTIWSEILNLEKEKISTDASFLTLGGHSLMAIQIANNIKKNFEVPITLVETFQQATIQQQAKFIEAKQWLKESSSTMSEESKLEIDI
ncbi:non-ribosomal peptide synthetase [Tenacibaculum sp. FZY0031]|uniref:non-ribosomal peptide synthetase n=1 Tax=Tenacibaculum sp. FZY0031 TaxID=3116648 RepID=UPI002EC383B8|nr:non-ribosomal peptide synthetase [Tenacibaculum sp. FZY0031]